MEACRSTLCDIVIKIYKEKLCILLVLCGELIVDNAHNEQRKVDRSHLTLELVSILVFGGNI
jgi:hypothetical protein